MFFIKKFSTIFLVLFTYANISFAQDRIVYLDLDNLVNSTQAGKLILTNCL